MRDELKRAVAISRTDGLGACLSRGCAYLADRLVPRGVHERYHRRRFELPADFGAYDHPPDPFATFEVPPESVERFSGRPYPPYHGPDARLGVVRGGEWDRREPATVETAYEPRYELYREGAERFEETTYFRSLERRFEEGVPWEDTRWYRQSLRFIEQDRPTSRGIASRAGLDERCAAIDGLYDRIRREGYRSQYDLGNHPVAIHEVSVDIGRDGEFLFVNGRNRLTIAKLLGIDRIPIGVYVRHRLWMERREAVASGRPPSALRVPEDHPDLPRH